MKDDENLHWKIDDIAHQYKIENQDWSWSQCWDKARKVYRELNKLNRKDVNDNKVFFDMNTPFSFYYDKDSEFGDKYELRNG